jgi:hypothetical protein
MGWVVVSLVSFAKTSIAIRISINSAILESKVLFTWNRYDFKDNA